MTAHAGKGMEQGKHSSIADESPNLYNHFGNQYGRFSEADVCNHRNVSEVLNVTHG